MNALNSMTCYLKYNHKNKTTACVFSQVYSLYYALPEERENDCNVFDLSVKMEKQLDGRSIYVFMSSFFHLSVTFNGVLFPQSALNAVSHPGAIESYLLTIET